MLKLFELLSIFDWIIPAKGFAEDVINDPTLLQSNSWTFFVPMAETPLSPWQIERLMKQNGVHYWGGQITGGEYFFSVKLDQAPTAEYLLAASNVPLWGPSQGAAGYKERRELGNTIPGISFTVTPAPSIWDWLGRLITGWLRN